MNFKEKWLHHTRLEHELMQAILRRTNAQGVSPKEWDPDWDLHYKENQTIVKVGRLLEEATTIRLSAEQAQVFMDMPPVGNQDARWMRLPFPIIYFQLDGPLEWVGYRDPTVPEALPVQRVKGIGLWENTHTNPVDLTTQQGETFTNVIRHLQVVFLMPEDDQGGPFLNFHGASIFVLADGTLARGTKGAVEIRNRMLTWMVHVINFLSSPSVKLARRSPEPALQKARTKRGKPPLPDWHEITYRKACADYTPGPLTEKRWEHSFRYDVRGHFKRFERGRMAGRVIWCPAHQRGLRHDIYRPKGYHIEEVS